MSEGTDMRTLTQETPTHNGRLKVSIAPMILGSDLYQAL
jgi:hypothetical protein